MFRQYMPIAIAGWFKPKYSTPPRFEVTLTTNHGSITTSGRTLRDALHNLAWQLDRYGEECNLIIENEILDHDERAT